MKTSTLNWISGFLGIWIIVVVFLGFSSTLSRIFLVVTGLAVAVLGFLSASRHNREAPSESNPTHYSEIKPQNGESHGNGKF